MSEQPQYEFTPEQNKVIDDLSSGMRVVGFVSMLAGVLYLVGFIGALIHAIRFPDGAAQVVLLGLAMLFFLSQAKWTDNAAREFGKVTSTTGQDISHLMQALDNLRKLYSMIATIIKVYLLFVLIGVIAMLVMLIVSPARG